MAASTPAGVQIHENIFSTLPNYPYYGRIFQNAGQDYGYLLGTSMAAPHVTGIVSLMQYVWNGPEPPSAAVVKAALTSSARILPENQPAEEVGAGGANLYNALVAILQADPHSRVVSGTNETLAGATMDENVWVLPNATLTVGGTASLSDNGAYTSNIYVAGRLVVPAGATLDISDGNDVVARPGGVIEVHLGARIRFGPSSELVVMGRLELEGAELSALL